MMTISSMSMMVSMRAGKRQGRLTAIFEDHGLAVSKSRCSPTLMLEVHLYD